MLVRTSSIGFRFIRISYFPRYNDSPDGDWVISRYPEDDSLILATAGSGHAYKVHLEFCFIIASAEDCLVPSSDWAFDR